MDAKRSLVSALSTLVVFCLCFVERGLSIRCFLCTPSPNVHGPEHCLNLPKLPAEKKNPHLQDCSLYGKNYTMCTKMYQDIDGDIRVFYGCASLGSVGCIKRAGTFKIKSTYCHCNDKDGCNGSPPGAAPYLLPVTLLSLGAGLLNLMAYTHV